MKIKKSCLSCGNIFETVESRIKDGRGKYCSKECIPMSKIAKSKNYGKWMIGKKHSETTKEKNRKACMGEKFYNFKGETLNSAGYVLIYVPSKIKKQRKVYKHRYVMEQYLGRKLKKSEHVHHINGDKKDNTIGNLKIINPSQHSTLHARKGENNHYAKLKNKDIIEIRKTHNPPKFDSKYFSKKYKVHKKTIERIINRKTWKDI